MGTGSSRPSAANSRISVRTNNSNITARAVNTVSASRRVGRYRALWRGVTAFEQGKGSLSDHVARNSNGAQIPIGLRYSHNTPTINHVQPSPWRMDDRLTTVQEILKLRSHVKCRNSIYPREKTVERVHVPDDKVSWSIEWDDYAPLQFTSKRVLHDRPVWADPDIEDAEVMKDAIAPEFNSIQGKINRTSHYGTYTLCDVNGVLIPRNPIGRTGIKGRGCLGRWGPNHAADPIVTRWKRDAFGTIMKDAYGNNILQFIAVQRSDTKEWALPGGMVDPGECVTQTVKREFGEEAMNSLEASDEEKQTIRMAIDEVFAQGKKIYMGYVDDPRNTDNAWMETVAFNFHDDDGSSVGKMELNAGDDAVGVRWADISPDIKLFASHTRLVRGVAFLHGVFSSID